MTSANELAALADRCPPLPEKTTEETDNPTEWRSIAIAAVADLFNYAHDELPHRRLVSANAYYERVWTTELSSPTNSEWNAAVEACAKIAEKDRRSKIAIKYDHIPDFQRHALSLAKEIRSLHRGVAPGPSDTAPQAEIPRPINEYHEDMGDVLWWKFPITEPPYVGSPLDLGFDVCTDTAMHGPDGNQIASSVVRGHVGGWPGYHTHFTLIQIPNAPEVPVTAPQTDGMEDR